MHIVVHRCTLSVLFVGLEIGERIHMFDTPEERYLKLVKVCFLGIVFVYAVINSSFSLLLWVSGLTVSSVTHSCLQLPSSSPCRSCWWCCLAFFSCFLTHVALPNILPSTLSHSLKIYASKCVQSICHLSFCYCALFKILLFSSTFWKTSTIVTLSTQMIFSVIRQTCISKASHLYQPCSFVQVSAS